MRSVADQCSLKPRGIAVLNYWMRSQVPLLAQYCRHVCQARLIAREFDRFQSDWVQHDAGPARLDS